MRLKVKKGIAASIFAIMFLYLFAHISYLFRHMTPAFLTYGAAERNSIDFVMVGSSTACRYFDPMHAWNTYGFASYDYSTHSIPAAVSASAIKELYKTQHPKVIAVETRLFVSSYWTNEISGGFRNFMDSIPFSANRMRAINYYAKLNDISFEDAASAYFDLIYYHTNIDQLSKHSNWDFSDFEIEDTTISNNYKGYEPVAGVIRYFDYELPSRTGGGQLKPESEKCYRDLLQFAKEQDIPLLLVSAPYIIDEKDANEIYTLQKIADEYDVPYLDTNTQEAWDEMGLDLMADFADNHHLNTIGDQKYTEYVSNYLVENYDLPDHRSDERYSSWGELYEETYLTAVTTSVEQIMAKVDAYALTQENEKELSKTYDCAEWLRMVDDSNITLLMCTGDSVSYASADAELELSLFGMRSYLDDGDSYIGVYSGTTLYSDTKQEEYSSYLNSNAPEYERELTTPYQISVKDGMSIKLGEKVYSPRSDKGIYVLAVDNHSGEVVDAVSIQCAEDGDLVLTR